VSGLTIPLAIFVLTVFYQQLPRGLEDAAQVAGTTRMGALFRVIVPLSGPGVATAAILIFTQVYNEFFFPCLVTNGELSQGAPIVPALVSLKEAELTFTAAASLLALLPVALVVLFANERLVEGLGTSAGAYRER
jgi:multiple sugar transport system permease protein